MTEGTFSKRRLAAVVGATGALRLGLSVVAWMKAPRHPVGAVGAVFDDEGRVLLVEHTFRTDFPWGLPGGWVERGEDPKDTVIREVREELGLSIEVGTLLASEQIGRVERSTHPRHLGLAYACRFLGGSPKIGLEVLSMEWVRPAEIRQQMAPFQHRAILLAEEALTRNGEGK